MPLESQIPEFGPRHQCIARHSGYDHLVAEVTDSDRLHDSAPEKEQPLYLVLQKVWTPSAKEFIFAASPCALFTSPVGPGIKSDFASASKTSRGLQSLSW